MITAPRTGSTSVLGHTFGVDEDDVLLPVPAGSGSSSSSLNPTARRRGVGGGGENRRSFAKRAGSGGAGRLGFGERGAPATKGCGHLVVLGWPTPSPWPSLYRWKPQVLDYKSPNKTRTQNLPCDRETYPRWESHLGWDFPLPCGGVAGPHRGSPLGTPPPLGLAGHGGPWWFLPDFSRTF